MKLASTISVRFDIALIPREDGMAKATLRGIRERFVAAVQSLLVEAGWNKLRANVYLPTHSGSA